MENNIKKAYQLPKSIKNKIKEVGFNTEKIEVCTLIEENKQNSYWYGGDTIKIMHNNVIFSIEAIGDIRFSLIRKLDNTTLFYVKDKQNQGSLYAELSSYIKDDNELLQLISGEHPEYLAIIDDNNWWECNALVGDKFYDLSWVLDSDILEEAVMEVIENIDNILEDII